MRCPYLVQSVFVFLTFSLCLGYCPAATSVSTPETPAIVLQGGHTSPIGGLAFAPNGRLLITAGGDNRILVWDVDSGLTVRTITASPLGFVAGVGVSADSEIAIVASASGVFGFDIPTGKLKWTDHVYALFAAFSPKSNRMALYDGHNIHIVDTGSGSEVKQFTPNTQVPSALALSSDGQSLAIGSGDHLQAVGGPSQNGIANSGISIFNTSTGQITEVLKSPLAWFSAVAFNRAGTRIAAVGYDGSSSRASNMALQLWTGKPFSSSGPTLLPNRATMSQAVSFGDDDSSLAIGEAANDLPNSQDLILCAPDGTFHPLKDPIGTVFHLSLPTDAGLWAGSGPGAVVGIWDTHTGALVDLLPTQIGTVDSIHVGGDRGSQLFVESRGQLHQMDLAVAREVRVYPLRDVAVDESGMVVAGDPGSILNHTVVMNSAEDTSSSLGEKIFETNEVEPGQSIYARTLDGKGTKLIEAVTTNGDNSTKVTVWDLSSKSQLFSFARPASPRTLIVLPDNDTLVDEDIQGMVLWSLSRKTQIYQINQTSPAAYVSYDPRSKSTARTICPINAGHVSCSSSSLTVESDGKVNVATKELQDFSDAVVGTLYIASSRDTLGTTWLCDWQKGTSTPLDYILVDSDGNPYRRIRKGANEFGLVSAITNTPFTGSWNSLSLPLIKSRTIDPAGARFLAMTSNGQVLAWSTVDGHFLYSLRLENSRISTFAFSPDGARLFTGDDSGGVRIWDLQSGRFLANYFAFGGGDWVLVDDRDRFAATRDAELHIGYRVGTEAVPFEQFDLSHNRPDLVMQEIGLSSKGDIAAAQDAVNRRLQRLGMAAPIDPAFSSLPELEIPSKAIPRTTPEREITVSVSARSRDGALSHLDVLDNGVPVYGAAGIPLTGERVSKTVTIPLVYGLNEILISATDKSGNESLRQINRVSQITNPRPQPRLFVVSAGITDYSDPAWHLGYAAGDAEAIAKAFNSVEGFDQVTVMPVAKNGEVTMSLLPKIATFLAPASENDEVILFLSGHGTLDAKGLFHFVTYDFDAKDPHRLGIRYQDLVTLLDQVKARRKLLLLDACFSGEPSGSAAVSQTSEVFQELSDLRYESGVASIAASSSSDPAYDDINGHHLGRSPFAFAIMKAMQSPSVSGNSGSVTLNSLAAYVSKTVGNLTGNLQQTNVRGTSIRNDFLVR
jgi:WD40 repeat protein